MHKRYDIRDDVFLQKQILRENKNNIFLYKIIYVIYIYNYFHNDNPPVFKFS